SSGKNVVGMIIEETTDKVTLIENPLASAKPTELRKSDIAARDKSNVSMMPKGLFDKLTKDEILDLLAYVYAGGNEKHAVYQGGGHHHQIAVGSRRTVLMLFVPLFGSLVA